jgi:hypothetical protein
MLYIIKVVGTLEFPNAFNSFQDNTLVITPACRITRFHENESGQIRMAVCAIRFE